MVGPWSAFKPSLPYHGLSDACSMMECGGKILDDTVRVGIFGIRADLEIIVLQPRRKDTPMGGMRGRKGACRLRGRNLKRGFLGYVGHSNLPSLIWYRSCPLAWCNWRWGTAFAGKGRADQLAIAGRLTVGSSLNGAMVSSVM